MKRFLVFLSVMMLPLIWHSKAEAAGAYGIQPAYVYQTGVSSITTNIVTVSTSSLNGATQVDSPLMANRAVLEIQNIDSSANLWCLAVSTTPTANNAREITPASSWIVSVMDTLYTVSYSTSTGATPVTGTVKFWCLSDGSSSTKAAVTQMY